MINRVDFNKAGIGETIRFESNILADDIYKEIKLDDFASIEVNLDINETDLAKITDEFDITEAMQLIREFGVSIGINIDKDYDYYHQLADDSRYNLLYDFINTVLLTDTDMSYLKRELAYYVFNWYRLIYQISNDTFESDYIPSNEAIDSILREIKRLRPFKVYSQIKRY